MSRKALFPAPKKKFHRGTWEIYWNWNFKRYSFYPGIHSQKDESLVESELRQMAVILASPSPVIPDRWQKAKYLAERYGLSQGIQDNEAIQLATTRSWLQDYEGNIRQECVERWATVSLNILHRLDAFVPGGIAKATSRHAGDFWTRC